MISNQVYGFKYVKDIEIEIIFLLLANLGIVNDIFF